MKPSACSIALVALLCLCACGRQQDRSYDAVPSSTTPIGKPLQDEEQNKSVPPSAVPPQPADRAAGNEAPASPPSPGLPNTIEPPAAERQIIRSGQISLRVASLDSAQAGLARLAAANGGYTSNSSRTRESGNTLSGTTELRIPSNKFDQMVASVRGLGDVLAESITAADVTAEYIDLNARLKTQQELEARLLKLLDERTGKLSDVVEVEAKLADVRNQIESVQGRLRYISNQVSLSTLTVNLVEPGAAGTSETETFGGRLARALDRGVDGLVDMVGGLLTLAIALLPIIAIALGLYYIVIRPWRRRRKERALAAATGAPQTSSASKESTAGKS